jgi:hypothetical protein
MMPFHLSFPDETLLAYLIFSKVLNFSTRRLEWGLSQNTYMCSQRTPCVQHASNSIVTTEKDILTADVQHIFVL